MNDYAVWVNTAMLEDGQPFRLAVRAVRQADKGTVSLFMDLRQIRNSRRPR